jgi:hypothetical protein
MLALPNAGVAPPKVCLGPIKSGSGRERSGYGPTGCGFGPANGFVLAQVQGLAPPNPVALAVNYGLVQWTELVQRTPRDNPHSETGIPEGLVSGIEANFPCE